MASNSAPMMRSEESYPPLSEEQQEQSVQEFNRLQQAQRPAGGQSQSQPQGQGQGGYQQQNPRERARRASRRRRSLPDGRTPPAGGQSQ